jgi:hypothetical protein
MALRCPIASRVTKRKKPRETMDLPGLMMHHRRTVGPWLSLGRLHLCRACLRFAKYRVDVIRPEAGRSCVTALRFTQALRRYVLVVLGSRVTREDDLSPSSSVEDAQDEFGTTEGIAFGSLGFDLEKVPRRCGCQVEDIDDQTLDELESEQWPALRMLALMAERTVASDLTVLRAADEHPLLEALAYEVTLKDAAAECIE